MSLRQFIDSVWFRALYRAAIVAVPILGGLYWWTWDRAQTDAMREVASVKAALDSANSTLAIRATDSENFQGEVREAVDDLGAKVDELDDKVFKTQVDVGVIKRLVTELRDQSVESASLDPLDLGRPLPVR